MKSPFFTRAKANEGIRIDLKLPDGTPTDCWIRVRGVDSDAYKRALLDVKARALALLGEEDSKEKSGKIQRMAEGEIMDEDVISLLASLVADWRILDENNEPIPFTPENVKTVLREAPQIADQINETAMRRRLFFGKSLTGSSNLPKPISSSPSPSPEALVESPSAAN